nr:MAG TPA: hypothetical protein [Caudoviricetes sp.]
MCIVYLHPPLFTYSKDYGHKRTISNLVTLLRPLLLNKF